MKVHRSGVTVTARHTTDPAVGDDEAAHFDANSCEVSPVDHLQPWEPLVTRESSGTIAYREDFSDPRTGWPNHAGSRYASESYEISHIVPISVEGQKPGEVLGTIAAYGPWWNNFRASLTVDDQGSDQQGEGMVFRLNDKGYYPLLLTRIGTPSCAFKLIKRSWPPAFSPPMFSRRETVILPWTDIVDVQNGVRQSKPGKMTQKRVIVECQGDRIAVSIDDAQVAEIKDGSFLEGYVGMAQFGYGRAFFRDLLVQSLP